MPSPATFTTSAFAIAAAISLVLLTRNARPRLWIALYLSGILLLGGVALFGYFPEWRYHAVVRPLTPALFPLCASALVLVLLVPAVRVPSRALRGSIVALLALSLWTFVIGIHLEPWLVRKELAALKDEVDSNEICRQTTGYTCGPAATATALRSFGITATESELALAALTTPLHGTPPHFLVEMLNSKYAGIHASIRRFKSINELPHDRPAIALTRLNFFTDHYVAVLGHDAVSVTIGDPLSGKQRLSHDEFRALWHRTAVILDRLPADLPVSRRGSP